VDLGNINLIKMGILFLIQIEMIFTMILGEMMASIMIMMGKLMK